MTNEYSTELFFHICGDILRFGSVGYAIVEATQNSFSFDDFVYTSTAFVLGSAYNFISNHSTEINSSQESSRLEQTAKSD